MKPSVLFRAALLTAALICSDPVCSGADYAPYSSQSTKADGILLTKNDGTTRFISFDSKPLITFVSPNSMRITTASGTLALDIDDIASYGYGHDPESSDIENIEQNSPLTIKVTDSELTISELSSESTLEIFSISGVKVLDRKASEGSATINISGLGHGVYILRINNNDCFKFSK